MATESTQPAPAKHVTKQDKDGPMIEVEVETKPADKAETKPADKAETRPADPVSRIGRAEAIIRRNVIWSLGAGVLPIPIFDVIAVTGVQVKMLAELSSLYDVKFAEHATQKVIGPLLSSLGSVTIGTAIGGSLLKSIPFVGTALGVVSVPLLVGAFTHATGKVFLMHFESGGTVLDFDPLKVRAYFKQEFEKSKATVSELHKDEQEQAGKAS